MKYPDIEKRVRKIEKQAAVRKLAVRVVLVRPDQSADEEVAKLGPLGAHEQLICVQFVRAADVRPRATLQ